MSKGKTCYRFNSATGAASAEQIIQGWLTANRFQPMNEGDTTYYRSGDAMVGYRFLEYQVDGSLVTIQAYLGSCKNPRELSDGLVGALPIAAYKNSLNELFSALNGPATTQPNSAAPPQPTPQANASVPNFQQSVDKKNNTFAEVSFWCSILVVLLSAIGVIVGAILIIVNYYMAVAGLKSSKHGKAVAAIIITTVAVAVMIVRVIIKLFE